MRNFLLIVMSFCCIALHAMERIVQEQATRPALQWVLQRNAIRDYDEAFQKAVAKAVKPYLIKKLQEQNFSDELQKFLLSNRTEQLWSHFQQKTVCALLQETARRPRIDQLVIDYDENTNKELLTVAEHLNTNFRKKMLRKRKEKIAEGCAGVFLLSATLSFAVTSIITFHSRNN